MARCCICGKDAESSAGGLLINGRTVPVCDECGEGLDQLESLEAKDPQRKKVFSELSQKMLACNTGDAVKETVSRMYTRTGSVEIERFIAEEKASAARERKEEKEIRQAVAEGQRNGTPLLVCGIIFAVLSVISFIISIQEVQIDRYTTIQVANIQSTVFSAAEMVAAVVCFAARAVVRAVNGRK